ncbi:hypothetical protein SLS62_007137 [Diatrype stigma]|uniref:NACHT domain-containing protein n=1 Tax=Diatrype stigma TaxID=117547 RepID=A0AAN9YR08_9PEZI
MPFTMSDPKEYTIGWICAVEAEYVAAQELLDEEHPSLASQDAKDNNIYTLGSIGLHKIAVACPPHWNYGVVSAANVARDMLRTFTNLRFGLMVGIGGGVPTTQDIRLGDIVVSSLDYEKGAVLQYDFGHTVQDKAFKTTGHQNAPPSLLQAAVQALEVRYRRRGNEIDKHVTAILDLNPRLQGKYCRPDLKADRLYQSDYVHVETSNGSCASSCGLDDANLIKREPRSKFNDNPKVHYGLIASGNMVMKDAVLRDNLAREKGMLCFEMEAAGLMNHFQCLVIRGICDYSDTHKNEDWQGYAAIAAAAYAKDLLNIITPSKVEAEAKLVDLVSDGELSEQLLGIISILVSSLPVLTIDVQSSTENTESTVGSMQVNAHFDKIADWLSPPDPSTNFHKAREQHHLGTGYWLLDSDKYISWKSERNSFLWLNGIPGCGKTILSSTVVADLEHKHPLSLLYFYFDFSDTHKQSFENAVRSFIYQLYYKQGDCRPEVDSLYSSCSNGYKQPSNEVLLALLQNLIKEAGEVWIVLDALDEHEDEGGRRTKRLLPWIKNLRDCASSTHILVTSRPEIDIKLGIEGWACHEEIISLKGGLVDQDIRDYVEAMVQKMHRWQSRPDIQKEIKDALVRKADGM